ncbi:lymphocyte antigen 75 [Rhinophrynus dorsalis]
MAYQSHRHSYQEIFSQKKRLIIDFSAPHSTFTPSLNSLIPAEEYSLEYHNIEDAISLIQQAGPSCWLSKIDIEDAFKLLPVHPSLWHLQGIKWQSKYYFATRLVFGSRSSPKIFNYFAEALCWLLLNHCRHPMVLHYLDDFLMIEPASLEPAALSSLINLFKDLNIPLAPSKTVGPATVVEFLGITLDSNKMEASLPAEKILQIQSIVKKFRTKTICSRKVQSLLGYLNFATRIILQGKSFISYLLSLFASTDDSLSITISESARSDLAMWDNFLRNWNGQSLFTKPLSTDSPVVFSDASLAFGYAAIHGSEWFAVPWPHVDLTNHIKKSQSAMQLVPIVAAANLWGHRWSGQSVNFSSSDLTIPELLIKGFIQDRSPSESSAHYTTRLARHDSHMILKKSAKDIMNMALAPNSKRNYARAWSSFQKFLLLHSMPHNYSTTAILEYATYCHHALKLSLHSIKLHLAGIRHYLAFIHPERPSILSLYQVKLFLKGLEKISPCQPMKRLPITGEIFRKLYDKIAANPFGNDLSIVLLAAINMGFFGFLRPSEFLKSSPNPSFPKKSDLQVKEDHLLFRLNKSKTDQVEHVFTIQHESTKKCLKSDKADIALTNCSETGDTLKWKWGSGHRLFNLGSQMCLGLDLSNPQDPLKMFQCNSTKMLWWQCMDGSIYGASQYKLSENNGSVTANYTSNDQWRHGSTTENICDLPYHVIYTRSGNSHGIPCEFPFLRNGIWHHDCIREVNDTEEWCSTTGNYDADGKWGSCLKPVNGCDQSWTENSELQSCYQFNVQSFLTWKEAYISCQSQGADLLSISTAEELQNITGYADLPEQLWIGLNRLDPSAGWQWSDSTPLSFINWDEAITGFSLLDGFRCGSLNVNSSQWQNLHCEIHLPYICEKKINSSKSQFPDYWHYTETQCEQNWTAYNRFCYLLQPPSVWEEADQSCKKQGADLISMHSLADVEMVVTTFQAENGDIWSGFKNQDVPALFKWSDGTDTHFTYWDRSEPSPFKMTPNCVTLSGKSGRWHVRTCNETFKSVCKKNGTINNESKSDAGCPQDKDWRRHGNFCYLIENEEVMFGEKCNLTVMTKFEQEFLNSLMKEHNKIEGKYYWTSLKGANDSGDYWWEIEEGKLDLTYSNWNTLQPAFPGGCVAMATGPSLGKWEVKDCETFKAQSICKRRIGSAEPEVIPKPSNSCPDGWHMGSHYCYKLFHHERILRRRSWEEAEGFCEELGGHLPSFAHSNEMTEFNSFLRMVVSDKRWLWVGLNKRNLALQGSWQWSDDSPVSSVVLPQDFLEEDYDQRDCVAFHLNQEPRRWHWMSRHQPKELKFYLQPFHCDAALEWVCQLPKDWKSAHGRPPVVVDGNEFWFFPDVYLTHNEAILYCESNGTELASLGSRTAQRAVQQRLKDESSNQLQRWWVKYMVYSDHSSMVLRSLLHLSFLDCWHISAHSAEIDRFIDCNQKLPFICEKRNASLLEKETQNPNQFKGGCPQNWTALGDKVLKSGDPYADICDIHMQIFGSTIGKSVNETQPVVPEDVEYEGHKYKIIKKNLTWYNALVECNKQNMQMVSTTDQYQIAFTVVQVVRLGHPMWIGLSSTDDGINYRWQDGKHVVLNQWSRDDHGYEACVYMDTDGFWKTMSCDNELPGVFCHVVPPEPEKKLIENTKLCPHRVKDTPWIPFRNSCYAFLEDYKTRISGESPESNHECRTLHPDSQFLSIRDEEENTFILNQLKPFGDLINWLWLGMFNDNENKLRWYDKSYVQYSNWRMGRPNVTSNSFFAIMNADGFWDIINYIKQYDAEFFKHHTLMACKIELDSNELYNKPMPPAISYENSTYHIIQKRMNWNEAVKECKRQGGNLASVHSKAQKLFLENMVRQDGFPLWLGLSNHEVSQPRFEWSDGSQYDFSPPEFNEPNDIGHCVFLSTKQYWESMNCMEKLEGAICYNSTTGEKSLETGDQLCPSSSGEGQWIREKDFCYGFDVKLYNFSVFNSDEATNICHNLDPTSVLLTINDKEENDFIREYLKANAYITNRIWLGVSPSSTGKDLKWQDGSPVKFSSWKNAQANANDQCAIFSPADGTWQKVSCESGFGRVVCKAPLKKTTPGIAIGFAIFFIVLFIIGLLFYLYKRRVFHSSTAHYRRTDDEMETMVVNYD